jgi:hypothetical protein
MNQILPFSEQQVTVALSRTASCNKRRKKPGPGKKKTGSFLTWAVITGPLSAAYSWDGLLVPGTFRI